MKQKKEMLGLPSSDKNNHDNDLDNKSVNSESSNNTRGSYSSRGGRGRGNYEGGRGRGNYEGGRGRGNYEAGGGRGNYEGGRGRGNYEGGRGRGNYDGGRGRGNYEAGGGRGNYEGGRGRGNYEGGRGRGNYEGGRGRGGRGDRKSYNDSQFLVKMSGVPSDIDVDELKEQVYEWGELGNVSIKSYTSRNYEKQEDVIENTCAFINFRNEDAAKNFVDAHDQTVLGHMVISVELKNNFQPR